jgi:integrase
MEEDTVSRVFDLLERENVKHRTMIYLLLYTGMRRGELCGLEWHDIDWASGTIKIERTSQYVAGQGIITKPPKTASGIRVVSVPPTVTQLLRHYMAWQSEEHLKIADRWQDGDRLFTQWDGKPIHPDTVSQWFDTFLKRHGLPHVTLHEIRHTNASHLIAQGVDPRTVAQRLGHNQVSTTMNIYAHSIKTAEQAAAVTLENSWQNKKADA